MKIAYINEPIIVLDINHLDDINKIMKDRSKESRLFSDEETDNILQKAREYVKNNPPVFISNKTTDD